MTIECPNCHIEFVPPRRLPRVHFLSDVTQWSGSYTYRPCGVRTGESTRDRAKVTCLVCRSTNAFTRGGGPDWCEFCCTCTDRRVTHFPSPGFQLPGCGSSVCTRCVKLNKDWEIVTCRSCLKLRSQFDSA